MSNPKVVVENPQAFSKELLRALTEDYSDGYVKEASEAGGSAVRRHLRENGYFRNIQPVTPVSGSDLTRWPGHDVGVVVDEMEIHQSGAVTIPLNETSFSEYYRAEAFITGFQKMATPEFVKNVHELANLKKIDLEKTVIDNSLRDLQTREDTYYMNMVDNVIGAPAGTSTYTGVQQNWDYSKGGADATAESITDGVPITRANYARYTVNRLQSHRLNNGVFLMNRKTTTEFLSWGRDEVGGDLAQDFLTKGFSALGKFEIAGVPHMATIKDELVADGEVYLFTEPDFLGKAYSLKDATMYVEKKKDLIKTSAEQILGISLANHHGVAKVTFEV